MNNHFNNNKTILDSVLENIKNNKILQILLENNAPHTQRRFFTLLNENETINNVPLGTGLNVSTFEPMEKYIFCDLQDIFKYFNCGIYLRQVLLPQNNPKFFMKCCDNKNYYSSNMMILGKKYDLRKPESFIELINFGLDIYDVNIIYWASKNGYNEVVDFLISNGANKKNCYLCSFQTSSILILFWKKIMMKI
uniref:Putative ankyrin repeat protein n=1 Tax=Moumouvirus sp. 'Monve' TaxID=1128131 RepID=H2EFF8_9VIRU|nr:putative ankyrin repeat protein [Moumouvirus Monve]